MTIAGEQPHALAVALDDQAVAIMLDLMKPIGAGWSLFGGVEDRARTDLNACRGLKRKNPARGAY